MVRERGIEMSTTPGGSDDLTRVSALIDFLEDYYRLARPPVRSISDYGEFLLRESQLLSAPGIALSPGAETWLSSTLPDHRQPPVIPEELAPWFPQARLSPLEAPALALTDDSSDDEVEAALLLEEWVAAVWNPWSSEWGQIEAARNFYKRLYSVRARLDRDRDSFELVWGFGRLRWATPKGTIDHPLITVRVELTLDDDGQLDVAPAGPPEIEAACLAEVALADRAAYQSLRQTGAADGFELWVPESRGELLWRMLRYLDHDGTIGVPGLAVPGSSPVVSDEWVLFVRRRQADYVGFLEAQRELYRDGATPALPFLSLVVDQPSSMVEPFAGLDGGAGPNGAADHTLYLPKAANEEQHRILRLAQQRPGVTAQGPPGTGKSHTIANLICHFVSQGKRVLVTAEKEQALSVLAEKLPPAVRQLTVAVLGTDEAARTRLEQAVNVIQDRVATYDPQLVRAEVERFEQAIAEIDANTAAATHRLRNARTAETTHLNGTFMVGVDPTPAQVAGWLREQQETLGVIADDLTFGTGLPLDHEQWDELVVLIRSLEPADVAECALQRPHPQQLRGGAELDRVTQELQVLRAQLAEVESSVADWSRIDATPPQLLAEIIGSLEEAEQWRREVAGSWLDVVRVECSTPLTREEWQEFTDGVTASREAAVIQRRATAAFDVRVPDPVDDALQSGLREARERFAAGKGVGRVFHRAAARAIALCSVDGRPPTTAEKVDLCLAALARKEHQRRLKALWANGTGRVNGPDLDDRSAPEDSVAEQLDALRRAIAWPTETWPNLAAQLRALDVRAPDEPTIEQIASLLAAMRIVVMRARERELSARLDELDRLLRGGMRPGASTLWGELADALSKRHWERWDAASTEAERLVALEARVARFNELSRLLGSVAPKFTNELTGSRAASAVDYQTLSAAWQWRQLEGWLSTVTDGPSAATLQRELEDLASRRLQVMEELVAARAWQGLVVGFDDRKRGALNKYLTAVKRFGRTGGKYAARWLREIRDALDESKDAVPVWIIPTGRVLSSFRPEAVPPFDVLIVDEASQIGLFGLPILALARKAIVVGDDQQTSPENVGLDRQSVFDLIDDHLSGVRDARTVFDADNSLFDVSRQKFPEVVVLQEHFRCLPGIISFSNNRYYDGRMIPLRDRPPAVGWNAVGTVFVPDGFRNGNDVNEPEAQAVVDLITQLCADPSYAGMSFGVVTLLGRSQSLRIQDILLDRLGPDVLEERDIRCGEAPDFQGDERDVIVISTVVDKPEGRRIGAMTDRRSERRLNVAASRAKNQLWVVHSLAPEDFPAGDPRAELIRHCQNPGSLDAAYTNLEARCDSQFERDILHRILEHGYRRVRTQYEVGRYRIDIVLEGPDARLAVECDGDAWHGADRWDDDRIRQQKLERAGWTFERIRASAFYRNPDAALANLWEHLEKLEIPTGDWNGGSEASVSRRTALTMAERRLTDIPRSKEAGGLATHEVGDAAVPGHGPVDAVALPAEDEDVLSPTRPVGLEPRVLMPPTETPLVQPEPSRTERAGRAELGEYVDWPFRPVGAVLESSAETVSAALIDIVRVEGPMHVKRLYQLHCKAAGGQRVGREMRQAYNRVLTQIVRSGRLSLIQDGIPGLVDRTVYVSGDPAVVLRRLGARQLTEVPRSEIQTLIRALGQSNATNAEMKRAVLNALGLIRLTKNADDYLDECIRYDYTAD